METFAARLTRVVPSGATCRLSLNNGRILRVNRPTVATAVRSLAVGSPVVVVAQGDVAVSVRPHPEPSVDQVYPPVPKVAFVTRTLASPSALDALVRDCRLESCNLHGIDSRGKGFRSWQRVGDSHQVVVRVEGHDGVCDVDGSPALLDYPVAVIVREKAA